jgi:hypothetical protein
VSRQGRRTLGRSGACGVTPSRRRPRAQGRRGFRRVVYRGQAGRSPGHHRCMVSTEGRPRSPCSLPAPVHVLCRRVVCRGRAPRELQGRGGRRARSGFGSGGVHTAGDGMGGSRSVGKEMGGARAGRRGATGLLRSREAAPMWWRAPGAGEDGGSTAGCLDFFQREWSGATVGEGGGRWAVG